MNRHEIFQEFETKLKNGQLYSCSLPDLNKYLEALLVFEGSVVSKYTERAAQIQTLNNLISVRTLNKVDSTIDETTGKTTNTIKELEAVIKDLNKRNTKLTKWVITLAVLAILVSIIQLVIAFTIKPKIILQPPPKEEVSKKSILTNQSKAKYEENELDASNYIKKEKSQILLKDNQVVHQENVSPESPKPK